MAKINRNQDRKKAAEARRKAAAQLASPFFSITPAPDRSKMPPKELAQELVWDAMDAPPAQQKKLLAEALALDPGNLEARRMTLMQMELSPNQRLAALRDIVAGFAAVLGESFFREHVGHFWALIETRPYMRARFDLVEAYKVAGQPAEAAAECLAMFELCPNDNLGMRYQLASLHLVLGELNSCRELLLRYAEEKDYAAALAWAWPLERFLAGELDTAAQELALARQQNPFVTAYIIGKRKLPKIQPVMYSPGEESEAILFAPLLKEAWTNHPSAMDWLEQQI